jgi:hypothetical protein
MFSTGVIDETEVYILCSVYFYARLSVFQTVKQSSFFKFTANNWDCQNCFKMDTFHKLSKYLYTLHLEIIFLLLLFISLLCKMTNWEISAGELY